MERRNLTMLMDFYELTMANSYFLNGKIDEIGVFELSFRKNPFDSGYSVFSSLKEITDYILNLSFSNEDILYLKEQKIFDDKFLAYLKNFKFSGDLISVLEGTVVYPNTPILTVVAPIIEAQLIETFLLNQVNHQSLIATKASRIRRAAKDKLVSDFGARRAHNIDSAYYGAKACYLAGIDSTSNTLASKDFNIPVTGTMAHSYVMSFESEYEAFYSYAKTYPNNIVLLIDTYNVLESGIKNVIKLNEEFLKENNYHLKAVRIDSGDIAYLSKKIRKVLDGAGLTDCLIIATNSLDEYSIEALESEGAKVDIYGVGERMITASDNPVFGGVYKLVAIKKDGSYISRVKLSDTSSKKTIPSYKDLYRVYNSEGYAISDYLTIHNEVIDESLDLRYISSSRPYKEGSIDNYIILNLKKTIIKNGKLVYDLPSLEESRLFLKRQLDFEVWKEEQRFKNPHKHYLDFSLKLFLANKEIEDNMLNKKHKKLIVFGGSFNPVTKAHMKLISLAKNELLADNVIVVPAKDSFLSNWKKLDEGMIYSADKRIKLLNILAADHPYIIVEDVEINNYTSGKTYDLLNYLREKHATNDITFMVGSDNLLELHKWYNASNLLRENKFVVFNRGDDDSLEIISNDLFLSKFKHNFSCLDTDSLTKEISSTKVRKLIFEGELSKTKDYLSKSVYKYLMEEANEK